MSAQLNRAARRKLERRAKPLIERIEEAAARCELVKLAEGFSCRFSYQGQLVTGEDFAVCVGPDGVRYGEREQDGFCSFEDYGPDGEQLFGYGGDGYDLEAEICRCLQLEEVSQ